MSKKTIYIIVVVAVVVIIGIGLWAVINRQVSYTSDISTAIKNETTNLTDTSASGTRGSCYLKADSQCIEYLGVAFSPDRIKAVCSNEGAVISAGACPAEAKVGGCRAMMGTEIEMISWSYSNGDKPVTGDMLNMNKIFCNGLAKSQWVDPSGQPVIATSTNS